MTNASVKEILDVTAVLRFVPAHALTTLARLTKLIPYDAELSGVVRCFATSA